jgi:hypothetical protein
MRHFRTAPLRCLWIYTLIIVCQFVGPSLRVMWAANGAGSQAARVPIARLSVLKLRGSSLPVLHDQTARTGIARQGPGTKRGSAGRADRNSLFALPDTHRGAQARPGVWVLSTLPASHPLRI